MPGWFSPGFPHSYLIRTGGPCRLATLGSGNLLRATLALWITLPKNDWSHFKEKPSECLNRGLGALKIQTGLSIVPLCADKRPVCQNPKAINEDLISHGWWSAVPHAHVGYNYDCKTGRRGECGLRKSEFTLQWTQGLHVIPCRMQTSSCTTPQFILPDREKQLMKSVQPPPRPPPACESNYKMSGFDYKLTWNRSANHNQYM